jgi:hypothetical protein
MSWTPLWAPNINHSCRMIFIIWKLQWPQNGYLHENQLLGSVNQPMQILSIRVIMPRWVPRTYCRWSCFHNKYIQFKMNSKRDRYIWWLLGEKWNGHNSECADIASSCWLMAKCSQVSPSQAAYRYIIISPFWMTADHTDRAVSGMNCLRSLERLDRRFESHSIYRFLCVGSGLATVWSLVQGVLPSAWKNYEI